MEDDTLIKVTDISKRFTVNDTLARSDSFLDHFRKRVINFRGMNSEDRIAGDIFWALKDINFEVKKGDTVGIVGTNGAGKTTLLKIVTQILLPSSGTIDVRGRIASLIGVGTGFHQELSGRENIYFNGTLLGMTRGEIDQKIESIIEFSELGDFVDTPIKYYSSGMRSRLGFSIAMNLDAEIMIIDEALAVGDIQFKQKSIKKMKETAFSGRTVLFVSHQSSMIQEVCNKALWLENGKMVMFGDTKEVVPLYEARTLGKKEKTSDQIAADDRIQLKSIILTNDLGNEVNAAKRFDRKHRVTVNITYDVREIPTGCSLGFTIANSKGTRLFRLNTLDTEQLVVGDNLLQTTLPLDMLVNGEYTITPDVDVRDEGWIIDPRHSKDGCRFVVAGKRKDVWDANNEGLVKPPQPTWKLNAQKK